MVANSNPKDLKELEENLTGTLLAVCRNGIAENAIKEFSYMETNKLAENIVTGGMDAVFTEFIKALTKGGDSVFEAIVRRAFKKALVISITELRKKNG